MANTNLPADWNVVDIRWPIPGNSFEWGPDNVEPLAAKKRIVIHATASAEPLEDGFTMAAYHISPPDSWPGIGVMFVATKDNYPGHVYPGGATPAGAQIQYVGDLATVRAGVWGMNSGSIHIEISGLFTPGNGVPSEAQLRNVRHLIDKMVEKNEVLPSINFYNQVTFHNAIALPDHGTECPGWQNPQFNEWFSYLQGGAEPSWWHAPAPIPEPTPVAPETPVEASDLVPGKGGSVDFKSTYYDKLEKKTIARDGAVAVNVLNGQLIDHSRDQLKVGAVVDVAGYFDFEAHTYARTVWSVTNGTWNGIDTAYFDQPTGQPNGTVAVTVNPMTEITPNPVDASQVASNVTDEQLQAATVPLKDKRSVGELIKELFAQLIALIIKRKKS